MECSHGLTAETCAVCLHGPSADESYTGPPPEIDYAWEARKHEVITGRSAKGATQQRVTSFGTARVIGALTTDVNGLPLRATVGTDLLHPAGAAARVLEAMNDRGELRRGRHGVSAWDVNRATRQAFALDEIPAMLGTDVMSYEQVIHGDRSSFSPCVYRTGSLASADSDELSDLAQALIVPPEQEYATHTGKLKWEPRYELPAIHPRKSERARTNRDGTVELPAPALDEGHYWHGFRLLPRAPLADKVSKRDTASKARNDARTIGTIKSPASEAGWAAMLQRLNRGERVIVAYPDGTTRTVTRGNDGRYATPSATPGKPVQARAAATMAQRLAS